MSITLYDLVGKHPHQRFSPYCWRAKMALKHKQLPFELRDWHFTEKDAIAFSGQGKVPVLAEGEQGVSDSWEIACYLEQTYPDAPSLFPGPAARSLSLFFKLWCEKELHPLLLPGLLMDIYRRVHPGDADYFRQTREARLGKRLEEATLPPEDLRERLHGALQPVRETLRVSPYLCGERPAFADYILFGTFQWARVASPVDWLQGEEQIRHWFERLLQAFDGYAAQTPAAAATG